MVGHAAADFVVWRDPAEAWAENWTFVVLQATVILLALAALVHAVRAGSGAVLLWVAAVGHGLFVEGFCYWLPELDNFHHGRALFAIFGGRMPFYIVVLYPAFYYTAAQVASTLLAGICPGRFRGLAELGRQVRGAASSSFAAELLATAALTGLLTALFDIPYDIMGPKMLHWEWHPNDPNVFERVGPFVPTTSFVFHITFAGSWLLAGVASHRLLASGGSLPGLLVALVPASLLPFPLGVLQIQGLYVVPHDLHCVPTAACLFAAVVVYLAIIAAATPSAPSLPAAPSPPPRAAVSPALVFVFASALALIFPAFAATASPEDLFDTGVHLPVATTEAACAETTSLLSLGGKALKSSFACAAGEPDPATGARAVSAGSRAAFPLLATVDDASTCAMQAQPLPYRAVVAPGAADANGVAASFKMLGTAFGAEGAASTRAAMTMATGTAALVALTLITTAWRMAEPPALGPKRKSE